ncbi:hypothetical protein CROQUDRAFT_650120 [Cronartium quercuum f. sp. fusiforme G11]|uniref:Phosphoribosylaminoimidazole carboxylase n=1 Tax=Cronartium quercuum f. sp. fusiforme G11 TaxID=708437 RepID=A0A9P6TH29_9BASI|nr:hypothetical protein CROQUDRAFT_650120 [Cronartium quercuum f. sp. fusiforme G11]
MNQPVIGVLGGGQLGRMMAQAAARLSLPLITLDAENSPASQVLNPAASHPQLSPGLSHHVGSFNQPDDISRFSEAVDVLTIEIEHVNVQVLKKLAADPAGGRAKRGLKIHPSPEVIEIIQDKYIQKDFLRSHTVPVSDFVVIDESDQLAELEASVKAAGEMLGFPLMLKSRLLAYDGRGNYLIKTPAEITTAITALRPPVTQGASQSTKLYAERFAPFVCEIAVMVVKAPPPVTQSSSASGSSEAQIRSYPPVETVHRDNICHTVFSPLRKGSQETSKRSKQVAEQAISALGPGAVGVFAVEMFLMPNGEVLVNEIAPRPHNSYHHTLSSTPIDQFTAHLLAISSRTLPPPSSFQLIVPSAAMVNILGQADGQPGMDQVADCARRASELAGTSVELYGKAGCRRGRKMGHINVVGQTDADVHRIVLAVVSTLPASAGQVAKENPTLAGFSHPYPLVSIIMGSDSDLPTMIEASRVLSDPLFAIPHELTIVSAHRTPDRMVDFARAAAHRGVKVIIAGAGGAAHLPGMVAALTPLPVIGVPVKGKTLDGVDSLHSIVQMPRGVPVATVAIGNSTNAALLAIRMLSIGIPSLIEAMDQYQSQMEKGVNSKVEKLDQVGWEKYQSG